MRFIKNKNFKFILNVLKKHPFYLLGFMLITSVWAIDLSLRPYLLKRIVNNLISANATTAFVFWGIAYVLSNLLVSLFSFVNETISLKSTPAIKKHTLCVLMQRFLTQPWDSIKNGPVGSINNKLNEVVEGITNLFILCFNKIFGGVLALLIAIFALWTVDTIFGFIALCWVVLYVLLFTGQFNRLKTLSRITTGGRSKFAAFIVDVLSNMKLVHLVNTADREVKNLQTIYARFVKKEKKLNRYIRNLNLSQGAFVVFLQGMCLYFLVAKLKSLSITPGDFVFILTLNTSIALCSRNLAQYWQEFIQTFGAITKNLDSFLDEDSKVFLLSTKNTIRALSSKANDPMIKISNLEFKYKNSASKLQIKKLTIYPGEKIALVGVSGSGKSTLAGVLTGMLSPQKGSIKLNGESTNHMTRADFNSLVSLIPQNQAMFNRTIKENICYGNDEVTFKQMIEAATKSSAHDFIMELPQQYYQNTGEKGLKLSGGEAQRLTLARVFLSKAPLLILDEATNQLDVLNEKKFLSNLLMHCCNKTIIFITHKLHNISNFEKVILVKEGAIIGVGKHIELLEKNVFYQGLWNSQNHLQQTTERTLEKYV